MLIKPNIIYIKIFEDFVTLTEKQKITSYK